MTRLMGMVLIISAAVACEPVTPPAAEPDPGAMTLALQDAPPDAAGLLLVLEGGPVEAMHVHPAYQLHHAQLDANRPVVLIRGELRPGPLALVTVPDRRVGYTVRVVEASAGAASGYVSLSQAAVKVTIAK